MTVEDPSNNIAVLHEEGNCYRWTNVCQTVVLCAENQNFISTLQVLLQTILCSLGLKGFESNENNNGGMCDFVYAPAPVTVALCQKMWSCHRVIPTGGEWALHLISKNNLL